MMPAMRDSVMTESPADADFLALYEEHPTPKRDPEEERRRLVIRPMESLERINHFVFGGKQSFGSGTRLLTAGAGTGDETLYLAEQLRDRGGEVVYLDSSEPAALVAQRRAAMRGLENITFHCGRIEDLQPEDLGVFDYVHCVDMLHQVGDPALCLRRLADTLTPDGGMGLVVKTAMGLRGGEALRGLVDRISPPGASLQQRYQDALGLATTLPPEHPFFGRRPRSAVLRDAVQDPGFLLEQLMASASAGFTVGAIHDLAEGAGLQVVEFAPSELEAPLFTLFYNPDFYIADPNLARQFAGMSARERQESAELLHGGMASHGVYLRCGESREALPTDEEMVPTLLLAASCYRIANGRLVITDYESRPFEFEATPSIQLMFHLIDGKKTIGEIVAEGNRMLQQVGLPAADLFATFLHLYSNLRNFGWVALRHKSVSPFARHDHLFYAAAGWVAPSFQGASGAK
jgi:SAM-dependent methyltransferase